MDIKLFYTLFHTARGWMGILASQSGILAVTLPQTTRQKAIDLLGEQVEPAVFSPDAFSDITQRFQDYYSGEKTLFPDALDFSGATTFQKQVWQTTWLIPYGETRSYGWVAAQIGKPRAARSVGQSLGKNPFLIIVPCHRVIAGDGTLGGFGCGLPAKQQLLELEHVG
ncbi:MAG: methylated-DNA--[protein]-cysteine S-methyltransferase [Dehalococcoidales bacterium]